MRDYVAWHDDYEQPGSRLHLRLLVVQDLLADVLDRAAPGPVRFVSICAGQGHDVLTVARRHRRGGDLTGRLVELDPTNVSAARASIATAGLGAIEVVEADAGSSDAYVGATSNALVLACGIFGNITDADIERTITFLPALCAPGAHVVWTRYPRGDILERIRAWLARAGFEPYASVVSEELGFGVGAARFLGEPAPLEPGVRVFDFVR